MTKLSELFVFYMDGVPHHYHSDRSVFDGWMRDKPWLYPPNRCEIARFVPDGESAPRKED
jgi:hypothetical protein